MRLVVVESPNKVAKIQHYLGVEFTVAATSGHFRDLPKDELGIDLATFAPTYLVDERKAGTLARIKKFARDADEVLLATDPDREGEAIAWHLDQVLHHRRTRRIRVGPSRHVCCHGCRRSDSERTCNFGCNGVLVCGEE